MLRAELLLVSRLPPGSSWAQLRARLDPFIRRRVRSDADAEDLLQDVLLRLHARLDQLQDPERILAWAYQATRNTLADHARRQRGAPLPGPELEPGAIETGPTSDEHELLASVIGAFVDELPDPYRDTLRLTELEGLTQREVADRLGVSLTAVKSRVQRGRARLRQDLDACCEISLDGRRRVIGMEPRAAGCKPAGCC